MPALFKLAATPWLTSCPMHTIGDDRVSGARYFDQGSTSSESDERRQ